jgi:periplasmic protein TonB
MDINKILSADVLDIIFDGKNKAYGAYEMRKTYDSRVKKALLYTLGLALFIFATAFALKKISALKQQTEVQEVTLQEIKEMEQPKVEAPPPPPPPKVEPPKIEITKFTPPKIIEDDQVEKKNEVKEQEKLDETTIGKVDQEGVKEPDVVKAPEVVKTGEVKAPEVKDNTDYDQLFASVEKEAEFPGGDAGWGRYVKKEIEKNIDELTEEDAGTVVVSFIVDKDGNVSDVEAGGELRNSKLAEIAVNAIKRGPKWTPGIMNGHKVKSRRSQPVTFQLQ